MVNDEFAEVLPKKGQNSFWAVFTERAVCVHVSFKFNHVEMDRVKRHFLHLRLRSEHSGREAQPAQTLFNRVSCAEDRLQLFVAVLRQLYEVIGV